MNSIITQVAVKVVEEISKNIEKNGISEIGKTAEDILSILKEGTLELLSAAIHEMDSAILSAKRERKQDGITVKERNVPRTVITSIGELKYSRTYFEFKDGTKAYITDQLIGIEPFERLTKELCADLLHNTASMSMQKAVNVAGVDVSRQTVNNRLLSMKDVVTEITRESHTPSEIHIFADEDHVHLQKGGIEEPRLIVVYDSIIKDGKRTKLCNKKHFGGVYKGKIDNLWEEVLTYIDNTYVLDKAKNIFILGDGASWIKTGLEWIPNSINVLDKFHLMKAINGIVGKESKDNKQEISEYKRRIYRSFYELDFNKTKEIVYEILAEEMEENTRKRKEKLLNYILNNKQGISNLYRYQKELHGCSAEGHISHLYSARLSSRPLGWKTVNVDNVSRLRLIKADNREISEIVHDKRNIIEFKEIEKIRHQAKEQIKESINFKTVSIPAMEFGTTEQRKFFKQILEYKKAV